MAAIGPGSTVPGAGGGSFTMRPSAGTAAWAAAKNAGFFSGDRNARVLSVRTAAERRPRGPDSSVSVNTLAMVAPSCGPSSMSRVTLSSARLSAARDHGSHVAGSDFGVVGD